MQRVAVRNRIEVDVGRFPASKWFAVRPRFDVNLAMEIDRWRGKLTASANKSHFATVICLFGAKSLDMGNGIVENGLLQRGRYQGI